MGTSFSGDGKRGRDKGEVGTGYPGGEASCAKAQGRGRLTVRRGHSAGGAERGRVQPRGVGEPWRDPRQGRAQSDAGPGSSARLQAPSLHHLLSLAGGSAMSFPATAGASTCWNGASTATGMNGTPTSRSCSPCAAFVTRSGISGAASSAAEGSLGPLRPSPALEKSGGWAARARRGGSRAGLRANLGALQRNPLNKAWGPVPHLLWRSVSLYVQD